MRNNSKLIFLIIFICHTAIPISYSKTIISQDRIERAITKASDKILSLQKGNGYWATDIHINPRETAYFIITAKYLEVPGLDGDVKQSANWLINHVNDDHGWGFFDKGGKSNISITSIVYLALKLAGTGEETRIMKNAMHFIENNGGIKATDIFCKTFYALFNYYKEPWNDPRAAIFFPPLEILYLDNKNEKSIYNNIAWGREAAVALSILKEYKNRESLFLKEHLIKEAERWIVSHQLEDGCWYTLLGTCLNMIALNEIDKDKHWPRILHAMSWINKMRDPDGYQRRFELSVWDTSFCIEALTRSKVPLSNPSVLKAGRWLINAQTMGGGKLWSNVPSGGWSYNEYNILYPDNDDTALAVMALERIIFRSYSMEYRKSMAIERGKMWLLYMQNDDGGWGTFSRFKGEKEYGLPPDATRDPSVADITGHVLSALGSLGFKSEDPVVKRAVDYLKKDQNQQGAWYGRWGLCYLYGTASVLIGLKDIDFIMNENFVLKAAQWLLKNQNADGGWGEYFSRWDNQLGISYTKMGPSNPEQTAWVVLALLSADKQKHEKAIRKGILYLLETQENDGSWINPRYTVLGLNPYRNTYYPIYFPLIAISRYANEENINFLNRSGRTRIQEQEQKIAHETFRMIKDFMPPPFISDFDVHYLAPPSIDIMIETEDNEKAYQLTISNSSTENIDDFNIKIIDAGNGSIIDAFDLKTFKLDDPISKKFVLSRNEGGGGAVVSILVKAEYKYRGKVNLFEKSFTLTPKTTHHSEISYGTILLLLFVLLFLMSFFILFKRTRKELLKYSLKNLLRHKLRTILSFVGIVIGIAATAGTISLGLSFQNKLEEDFRSFGKGRIIVLPKKLNIEIGPPKSNLNSLPPLKLTHDVVDQLKIIENIKKICPVMHYDSNVKFKGESITTFIQFVDTRAFRQVSPLNISEGFFLKEDDLFSANIGYDVAHKAFSKKVKLNSILKIGNYNIRVKGIFAKSEGLPGRLESIVTPNIVIFLPLKISNRFLLKDYFDALELKVINNKEIENTDKKINQLLQDLYPGNMFSTVFTAKLQSKVSGILHQFNMIISLIGIFCLVVSGIGIMNIMIVNVNERRSEIGILKALGAKNSTIFKIFWIELTVLGFFSALSGFLGGLTVILIAQSIANIHTPPNLFILFCLSIFLGEVVVLAFGTGPILNELKKEPIGSIREN